MNNNETRMADVVALCKEVKSRVERIDPITNNERIQFMNKMISIAQRNDWSTWKNSLKCMACIAYPICCSDTDDKRCTVFMKRINELIKKLKENNEQ